MNEPEVIEADFEELSENVDEDVTVVGDEGDETPKAVMSRANIVRALKKAIVDGDLDPTTARKIRSEMGISNTHFTKKKITKSKRKTKRALQKKARKTQRKK